MDESNKTVVAVKGLVLNGEGEILIVQRAPDDEVGAGTWEFPGGKIDFGEDLEGALMREIKEETNIDAAVGRILYAISFNTQTSRQVVLLTYLCRTDSKKVALSGEHSAFHWVKAERLREFLPDEILSDLERHHIFSLQELNSERKEARLI
jgi:8-oxo-dGTP diphosphatase